MKINIIGIVTIPKRDKTLSVLTIPSQKILSKLPMIVKLQYLVSRPATKVQGIFYVAIAYRRHH